jgi:hypothetical protein
MTIKGGGIREEMIEQYKNIGKSDDRKETRLLDLNDHRKAIRDKQHEYRRGIPPTLSKTKVRKLCTASYRFRMEFPTITNTLYYNTLSFSIEYYVRATYILLTGLSKIQSILILKLLMVKVYTKYNQGSIIILKNL